MRVAASCVLLVGVVGCGGSYGPVATDMSSASMPSLSGRIEFLQRYVKFRRTYRTLDFHIVYRDNGGVVPGPSEWDVRLVAAVPPEELASWVPAGVSPVAAPNTDWLEAVPAGERASGTTEWYVGPGRVVGVDRVRSVVAYRSWKY